MASFWHRLPEWMHTVRFRLTVLYSSLLFGLAALVVGLLYLGLSASVRHEPVANQVSVTRAIRLPDGEVRPVQTLVLTDIRDFERAVNRRTLEELRKYSFAALGGLFVASLGIGWVLAGRALRPIGRITAVAQDIQSSDLSRRIELGGPDDELRRLADTFDAMLARLDRAFADQRQLIDDASHELRNPLAVIRTNVDDVLADGEASEADLRRTAEVVQRTSERMSRLVEDLLATARRQAPTLEEADVDLADVADEAATEVAPLADARRLRLERRTQHGAVVIADRDALRRAVDNLLDNAIRVSPFTGAVTLGTGKTEGWCWLAVADQGPGIEPADQASVFDRFWRGRTASAEHHTGLGLAIVRQIVESHCGQVRVWSSPGTGATFVIWLPVRSPDHTDHGLPPDVNPLRGL